MRSVSSDRYGLFTFDPLQNLPLSISKMQSEAVLASSSSEIVLTKEGHTTNKWNPLTQRRKAVLHARIAYVTATKWDGGGNDVGRFFARWYVVWTDRNFITLGLGQILEWVNYCTLDNVFPFLAKFIVQVTRLYKQEQMTRLHAIYSERVRSLEGYRSTEMKDDVGLRELKWGIMELDHFRRAFSMTLGDLSEDAEVSSAWHFSCNAVLWSEQVMLGLTKGNRVREGLRECIWWNSPRKPGKRICIEQTECQLIWNEERTTLIIFQNDLAGVAVVGGKRALVPSYRLHFEKIP